MKKEKDLKLLDSTIELVQIEKYADDIDRSIKKKIKKGSKKVLLTLIPILITAATAIIFPNPITIVIFCTTSLASFTINTLITKDYKRKGQNKNGIFYKTPESEDITEKEVITKRGKDFYTNLMQEAVNYKEPEEDRKYREAVERQNSIQSNFEVWENPEKVYLNKEETIEQVIREIDFYCKAYNIPELNISNDEWDKFFDVLYKKFVSKDIEYRFYDYMSDICRYAISKALVNNSKQITIKDLTENLYYLEKKYNDGVGFSKKELLLCQKEILGSIYKQNTINFQDYKEGIKTKK